MYYHQHRRNHGWRVGGDLTWSGCRSISFPPPPFSRYCSTHVSPIPFCTRLSLLKFSWLAGGLQKHCKLPTVPAKKMTASCKSWIGPNARGPHDLQSWRGRVPLHWSHRAVAPMPISVSAKTCEWIFCDWNTEALTPGRTLATFFLSQPGTLTYDSDELDSPPSTTH